ncbi:MAG: PAS domain S-box protein, partial [Anaerolineaceae bacterium]|nr:PAS domain S-box protein [Anaerolineaceae bacterium]
MKEDADKTKAELIAELNMLRQQVAKLEVSDAVRKQAEAALRESEARYRAVVEDQTEFIARMDLDGTFTFVNESYCRLLNKTREELVGKKHGDFMSKQTSDYMAGILADLTPENPVIFYENRFIVRGGEDKWLSWVSRLILDDDGNALEYQRVGRDITERKQGEESLQKAHEELDLKVAQRTADLTMVNEALQREIAMRKQMENALKNERDFSATILRITDALVIVLDLQGRIVSFNRACETCSGYSSDEVLGRPFWDFLLLPEEKDPVKAVFADLETKALPNRFENFWLTKDGRRRLIAWSNSVLKDGAGSVEFVVATGVDITER